MDPTLDGFKWFVQYIMLVPPEDMPDDTYLQTAFDEALNIAYSGLATIPSQPTSPSVYAWAVYNLAAHYLVGIAADDPGPPPHTYWSLLRDKLGLNNWVPGLITSAADQGTSEATMIPKQLQGLTMMGLDLLKTPWGRKYLEIAGQWGYLWGLTA